MYNRHNPLDSPPRPNRISFYLFNPQGGLGVGSYVQEPIHKGQWIHVVGVADPSRTLFYKNGQFIRPREMMETYQCDLGHAGLIKSSASSDARNGFKADHREMVPKRTTI